MKRNNADKEIELVGHVVEVKTDGNEDDFAVAISTEEGTHRVEHNELGEELFDRLDMKVEVVGFWNLHEDGSRRLRVTDYRLLPEDELPRHDAVKEEDEEENE
jgi:uncharacterized protein YuzE